MLALALTPREAAGLLARAGEVERLWPSAVVAALGDAVAGDEQLWREVTATLDDRLAPWLAELGGQPLRDLLARVSGDDDVDVPALTALLGRWSAAASAPSAPCWPTSSARSRASSSPTPAAAPATSAARPPHEATPSSLQRLACAPAQGTDRAPRQRPLRARIEHLARSPAPGPRARSGHGSSMASRTCPIKPVPESMPCRTCSGGQAPVDHAVQRLDLGPGRPAPG
ncbi:hypothetical protein OV079_47710 [Nannocystis pusilla]|uniref:Uncharacterized protein n=1 Tax=Nannocystis pusilla TaxID=889268 RepID=A0A9X3F0Q0_9BACT|nr:hypothetical protein [Nannocystis pusilla]MCY1013095.1 hypothetical protein [Nannocystis pusilla]